MTIGVGNTRIEDALNKLTNMAAHAEPIGLPEFQARVEKAQALMKQQGVSAMYLNAGTNLEYFTGLKWYASERLVGALVLQEGPVKLVAPAFEEGSLTQAMVLPLEPLLWEEHESPTELMVRFLNEQFGADHILAIDESTAYAMVSKIQQLKPATQLIDAVSITAECRMHKSATELQLIQTAMNMTLEVHKATASILHEGIKASEVKAFIHEAHKRVGSSGSFFCIVLFGEATAYPHGVSYDPVLAKNDWVLIDTGCKLHGYLSDITRTYAFGEATEAQREFWEYEHKLQQTAFKAAKLGATCGSVDDAVREKLKALNLEADYRLPGVPHRTGHGIGMDIHEWPYLVGNDQTKLAPGMCFSNEPMVINPGQFGVRLEDHFYMTENGPKWFTEPSRSLDDPFNMRLAD